MRTRLVPISKLKGHEVLGRHITTDKGLELIAKGAVLKLEYIKRLAELGIEEVYITRGSAKLSKEEVYEDVKESVARLIKTHIYKKENDLKDVCILTTQIIENLLDEELVLKKITEVQNKEADLYDHLVNVCCLSTLIAVRAGFSRNKVEEIAKGALLHDIGIKYVSAPYKNVDPESLSKIEESEYKKHAVYGYDTLVDEEWLGKIAKDIILFHHERNDGTGYPFRFLEENISREVQLVGLCDFFDAAISGIGLRKRPMYLTIEYIKAYAGIKFNQVFVDMLLSMVASYNKGQRVLLSSGEEAVVIKQNIGLMDRPVVRILDKTGKECDLSKDLCMFITDVVEWQHLFFYKRIYFLVKM